GAEKLLRHDGGVCALVALATLDEQVRAGVPNAVFGCVFVGVAATVTNCAVPFTALDCRGEARLRRRRDARWDWLLQDHDCDIVAARKVGVGADDDRVSVEPTTSQIRFDV